MRRGAASGKNGRSALAAAACAALVVGLLWQAGCSGKAKRTPRARLPESTVIRDSPSVLRNTIGVQTTVRGMEPVLVSGYGLVVGLNGTGARDIPGPVRAVMEREMLALGVGREVGPFGRMTPNDLLDDPNTAVVIVSAIIPPGSPTGTRFDVQVDVLPGTSATSLEGGTLYTTKLYRGLIRPAAPTTASLGEARGQMFINPFADPEGPSRDAVRWTKGRVLNGGVVTEPQPVFLSLDAPSHTRARAITDAINTRFPRGSGEKQVARGRNEELIEILVPRAFRGNPDEFIQLVRHLRVDQAFPEQAALEYARALREQPELAESLSWCFQSLGPIAVPYLRDLYAFPEDRPRMAAIQAGAKLGDMLVQPHLEDLALSGPPAFRPDAVQMMGRLGQAPKINLFLRDMLNDPDVEVRVAAYEALSLRRDPWVERRSIPDKFVVDTVPSAEPMVYVTIQSVPKIVIFGSGLEVRRPVFVEAWNGRLMLSSNARADRVSVYHRDPRSGSATTSEVRAGLTNLIEYLSHKTTPEEPAPGLDFTYSQVVGALGVILSKGGASAAFVPESDRLSLALLRSRQTERWEDRPESSPDGEQPDATYDREFDFAGAVEAAAETARQDRAVGSSEEVEGEEAKPARRQYVVPLGSRGGGGSKP